MEVIYDRGNDEYYVKEKYEGQTYRMGFQIYENGNICIAYIYIQVYSKRKHICQNEDEKKSTGKHPFHSYVFFKNAFATLEYEVMCDFLKHKKYDKLIICCWWVDNRRRDAYYKFLSRYGYDYSMLDGRKMISKTFTREQAEQYLLDNPKEE